MTATAIPCACGDFHVYFACPESDGGDDHWLVAATEESVGARTLAVECSCGVTAFWEDLQEFSHSEMFIRAVHMMSRKDTR